MPHDESNMLQPTLELPAEGSDLESGSTPEKQPYFNEQTNYVPPRTIIKV